MKKLRNITVLLLSAIVLFSCFSVNLYEASAAETNTVYNNKYPMIFVHGYNGWGSNEDIDRAIPYWGATTGDLMKYLRSEGYECYSASVGPISSAWDRACELYAQLTGTRVDYGQVHSKEHNHKRYGRTYTEPLFEGWSSTKKIHLIGHSFGGTTVRMLTYLMTYGCSEEVKGTSGNVSPLFTGGKENNIESVTTICTPHNSASTYRFTQDLKIYEPVEILSAIYVAVMGRSPLNGNLVDFHLEQFGITNTPDTFDSDTFVKSLVNFINNSDDGCMYDLTPEGMAKINGMIKISPHIYYYSYAFDTTETGKITGLTWPIITTNPIIAPISYWIGHHRTFTDETTGQVYDEKWHANDALCNTESETYPFTEAHRDYDGKQVSGVWNVMPVQRGDHGTAIGLLADRKTTRKFYLNLAQMLTKLEK